MQLLRTFWAEAVGVDAAARELDEGRRFPMCRADALESVFREAGLKDVRSARECGKTLLVLDTANEVAERLYERLGWLRVGAIPGFALLPHGGLCGTTVYYRNLRTSGDPP
jgi:hypothetical protein